MNARISRRTVLRGLGTAVALPLLDCMNPLRILGSETTAAGQAVAGAASPRRMAFIYVPNGIHMQDWTPTTTGANFELPATLKLLERFKDDMLVLSGLTQDWAFAHGDGPGDHARAMAVYLTGCKAKKTNGADIKVGISADQLAAQQVGGNTRFASLEIGCDPARQAGNCDSGYSCAYSTNLSWKTDHTPVAKEINPRSVFDRLFGTASKEAKAANEQRDRLRKSVLDFVLEDARRLDPKLGAGDRRKLDEYFTAVRELERRIQMAHLPPATPPAGTVKPDGIPGEYAEHLRLMADLLVLAFQTDSTRIATFVFANEGSNRSYSWLGMSDGHHDLSHHQGDKEKQEKIARINRFHVEQLAYLLDKLKSIKEGEGTLLDSCMISYGSGIGDGNRHNHDDLPTILFGRGGGTILPGRHVVYPNRTPLNNLWLAMLERMDVQAEKIGDSTASLRQLDG